MSAETPEITLSVHTLLNSVYLEEVAPLMFAFIGSLISVFLFLDF